MTVDEFKEYILTEPLDSILENTILNEGAAHVTKEQIDFIINKLSEQFAISSNEIKAIIVGSAKLGFSITEKKKDNIKLERYRPFSLQSDIDIAIISQPIFELIWHELSKYSYSRAYFPWISNRFGDYLVCGWIRPDHFPKNIRLRRCDDWWDVIRNLSSHHFLGRRKIRIGLYYNIEHLKSYQSKALTDCINFEKIKE